MHDTQWLSNYWPPKLIEERIVECHDQGVWPISAFEPALRARVFGWIKQLRDTVW